WRHISRQFIQKGLIVQELKHGSLKLTPKAWDVLRGKEKVMGRLEEASAGLKQREEGLRYDPALFNLLRKKRKEIADHANLPPFAIFHDRTLREMAAYFPQTKESLSRIYGLGAAKLEKYGAVFLEIICPHSRIHPLPEQPPPAAQPPLPAAVSLPGNRKHRRLLIGEAYQQGRTVEQLAVDFGIKPGTALEHLYQYWQDGHPLACDEFRKLSRLAESQKQTVLTTFDHLGTERLRPIFDALNGEIAYDEIKLLRLSYLCGRRAQPLEYKTFVCLATSRKYGGYCVAGKEWSGEDSGPWIRPVGEEASGELSLDDIRMNNGNIPQLLDIIHLPVIGSAPHAYQKENIRTVKNHGWNWRGKLPATTLAKLCDDVALLWMNGHHSANGLNDRIPEEMAHKDIDASLYLIRPDDFRLVV
ncbi:MAG: HRDC domain-containing protein, partial [Syntrophales bacterium]|nr:HRDC domain-containing protein [Syntrophales bacterium]